MEVSNESVLKDDISTDFDVQKYEIDKRIVISVNYCSMYGNYSDIYIQDRESQMII
jgi:hypothetical protein